MTGAQKRLMQVAKDVNNKILMVRLALLANVEGGNSVYLPNAQAEVASEINAHEFAGYLSALCKEGFYRPTGEYFGEVLQHVE